MHLIEKFIQIFFSEACYSYLLPRELSPTVFMSWLDSKLIKRYQIVFESIYNVENLHLLTVLAVYRYFRRDPKR